MTEVIIRSRFDDRVSVPTVSVGESCTKQSFAKEADINNIMARYVRTGILVDPTVSRRRPLYGDFSGVADFRDRQNQIAAVNAIFDQLPADVRSRLKNDPGEMIALLSDPEQHDLCVELGLLTANDEPAPALEAPPAPEPPEGEVTQ